MDLRTEMKKLTWRYRFRTSEEFLAALETLVLEKLAESGENSEDDVAWVRRQVQEIFNERN